MYAKIGRISSGLGTINPLRGDQNGGLVIGSGGDYKDASLAGKSFVAYQASSNAALWSATSAIGLQVYNPANSGVNLVLGTWAAIVWATSATMTGMVLAIANALTNPPASIVAPTFFGTNPLIGTVSAATGKCIASTTCTIAAAPVRVGILFHNTAAIATTGAERMAGDFQGMFVFAPGTIAVIGALGAAGVTVDLSLTYTEEVVGS